MLPKWVSFPALGVRRSSESDCGLLAMACLLAYGVVLPPQPTYSGSVVGGRDAWADTWLAGCAAWRGVVCGDASLVRRSRRLGGNLKNVSQLKVCCVSLGHIG